jgi:Spx/MgsR family transcriptional regulator
MPEITVHGIENCDQVRKARAWLRAQGIDHRFHDFRREGLERERLARWISRVPWDSLLNRRGLAWRKLSPEARESVTDAASAAEALLADPTLVKRPVLEHPGGVAVGFSEAIYQGLFGNPT